MGVRVVPVVGPPSPPDLRVRGAAWPRPRARPSRPRPVVSMGADEIFSSFNPSSHKVVGRACDGRLVRGLCALGGLDGARKGP